jgi:hypothetical protein
MKKLLTILIIASCLYQSIGFYVIAKIQELRIKREIQSFVSMDSGKNLRLIPVNAPNDLKHAHSIKFVNHKEFLYQGHLYDLVAKINLNGLMYLWAYKDVRETKLVRLVKNLTEEDSPSNSGSASKKDLIKLLITNWFAEKSENINFCPVKAIALIRSVAFGLIDGFYVVSIPPPKYA